MLADAPPSPERWEQELTLLTSLARSLLLLRGYTGEVEEVYLRATAMFEHPPEGSTRRLFPVLRGLSSFYGFRGEVAKGIEIVREILRLADEEGDASVRIDGTIILGAYSTFLGEIREGLQLMDGALAEAEAGGYRSRRLRLGNDLRVSGYSASSFVTWLFGRPDDALARADRAVALARELDHPYSHRVCACSTTGSCGTGGASRSGFAIGPSTCWRSRRPTTCPSGGHWATSCSAPRAVRSAIRPRAGGRSRTDLRPVPGPADAAGVLADGPLPGGGRPPGGRGAGPRDPARR